MTARRLAGLLLLAFGGPLGAQDPPPAPAAAKPTTALEAQRASVRQQVGLHSQPADSFFIIPFPAPGLPSPGLAVCTPVPYEAVESELVAAAKREDVKLELLRAVARQESAFDSCAESDKGAQGVMQLMPATQERFGVTDPFDFRQNVAAGAKLLKQLLEQYKGDLKLALSAYNAGIDRVKESGGVPPIPETRNYVESILKELEKGATPPSPSRAPP